MAPTKPKPTRLKLLSGNAGKRKINKNEPQYSKVGEQPPASLDAIGKAEWNRVVGEMRSTGVLTKADEKILWCYCAEFSTAERAVLQMQKPGNRGLLVKPPNGYPIQNPYLAIQRKSFAIMKSLAGELGLTPSSRSRVTPAPTKGDDPYTKLKEQRAARLATVQAKLKEGKPHRTKTHPRKK